MRRAGIRSTRQGRGRPAVRLHQPALRAPQPRGDDESAVRPLVRGLPRPDGRRRGHRPHRPPTAGRPAGRRHTSTVTHSARGPEHCPGPRRPMFGVRSKEMSREVLVLARLPSASPTRRVTSFCRPWWTTVPPTDRGRRAALDHLFCGRPRPEGRVTVAASTLIGWREQILDATAEVPRELPRAFDGDCPIPLPNDVADVWLRQAKSLRQRHLGDSSQRHRLRYTVGARRRTQNRELLLGEHHKLTLPDGPFACAPGASFVFLPGGPAPD